MINLIYHAAFERGLIFERRFLSSGEFMASDKSILFCEFSQNSAVLSKIRANSKAVYAVIDRRSRHNSLMSLRGTPMALASSVCEILRGSINSSIRISSTLDGFRFVVRMIDAAQIYI